MDFGSFISALLGGLVVASATYIFDTWTAQGNKRREERLDALLKVFKSLDSSDRKLANKEIDELEEAISLLQIYGSPYLIEKVILFRNELTEGGTSKVGLQIMNEVRNEIRGELGLPAINSDIKVFRYSEFLASKAMK